MGITVTLYKLTEDEYSNLPSDEFDVIDVLIPSDLDSNPRFCDLDKSWSMLHYLLCGSPEADGSLLGDAILGGEDTSIEMDFGPARYRSPEKVTEINDALMSTDLDCLYSQRKMQPEHLKDIYLADVFIEEGVVSLRGFFEELQKFYSQAASEKMAIVSYLA